MKYYAKYNSDNVDVGYLNPSIQNWDKHTKRYLPCLKQWAKISEELYLSLKIFDENDNPVISLDYGKLKRDYTKCTMQ